MASNAYLCRAVSYTYICSVYVCMYMPGVRHVAVELTMSSNFADASSATRILSHSLLLKPL